MKYFNVAGPCIEGKHYMLDATERLHNELSELISSEQYFVIHAARQTGKTTLLINLANKINKEGKYYAVYCSLENAYVTPEPEKGIPTIVSSFQTVRDGVVFTNRRIIAINIQGVTGTKKDFTSLPYNKIQAFSVETAGILDLESELELWFSGMGKVRFEFAGNSEVAAICRTIGQFALR